MQIAINISKEVYENIQRKSTAIQIDGDTLENAVLNGTPLPKDTCEDAVSRNDIYFKLTNGAYLNETTEQFIDRLIKELKALPPVTPTRKKGKWIINKERDTICCPFCHDKTKIGKSEVDLLSTAFSKFNFCPLCGADMREVEE